MLTKSNVALLLLIVLFMVTANPVNAQSSPSSHSDLAALPPMQCGLALPNR